MRLQHLFESGMTHYQYFPQQGRLSADAGRSSFFSCNGHDGQHSIKQFAVEKILTQALAEENKTVLCQPAWTAI